MPFITNALFLTVFGVLAIYGFISVMRGTRKIRAPRRYAGALFGWSEPPGDDPRDDFPTWIALTVHRGTTILLGLVALLILIFRPVESLTPLDWPPGIRFVLDPLVVGIVSLIGFFWGFMAGGPIADVTGGHRYYAVSEAGMLGSGRLTPWEALSHVSIQRGRSAIRLWSASLAGTVAYSLHPPEEGRAALLEALQSHLPTRDQTFDSMQRYGLPVRMIALCAPFIAGGIILYWMPPAAALTAIAVLMWLLITLGSSLIMRWVYGGKSRPAAVEK